MWLIQSLAGAWWTQTLFSLIIFNVAAKNPVRPSKRKAEGGFGGNSAFLLPNQNEASPATCLNTWKAGHHRKILFSLRERKIRRAQNEKSKEYFSVVWRAKRAVAGLASSVGVLRKMGSDFFKQTPPFQICRRSCLGASPLRIGFRPEIPRGFEIRRKNSRRKSAVPKQGLDCAKGARADEERFLEIVGVSAMPLSI